MIGHLFACLWIIMGQKDKNKLPDERESWIYVNDFDFFDDNDTTPFKSDGAAYIFALYWVFTVLTTVGYGDYAGGTTNEYLVTICFEFVGFCYSAILISVMSNVFAAESSF